jgi:hypothetical protein
MFAAAWLRLMDSPEVEDDSNPRGYANKLERILHCYPHEITQRTASIAASFIMWLGTNCGRSFLMSARTTAAALGNTENGYVAAWAIENRRVSSMNNAVRTVESILQPDDHGQSQDMFGNRRNIPILSAAECEVVEALVEWISSEEGMAFVNKCESDISKLREAQVAEEHRQRQAEMHLKTNAGDTGYAP